MAKPNIDILNEVLALQYRSLAQYITHISPWKGRNNEKAYRTLQNLVSDQNHYAHRLADLIVARGGVPDAGEFPVEFTDMHMLSLQFLIRELIRVQKHDIELTEAAIDRLGADREARSLVEEVLGSERGHLELLEELTAQTA